MNKKEKAEEVIDRIRHNYMTTEGVIDFPNSDEGDILKMAYTLSKEVLGIAIHNVETEDVRFCGWLYDEEYGKRMYVGKVGARFMLHYYDNIKEIKRHTRPGVFENFFLMTEKDRQRVKTEWANQLTWEQY